MSNKTLYIISFVFLVFTVIFPLSLSNCGLHSFFVSMGCEKLTANYCGGFNLNHLNMMRDLLAVGSAAISFILALLIFKPLYSLCKTLFKQILIQVNLIINQIADWRRLKPFNNLALAYANGLIQPKTDCCF